MVTTRLEINGINQPFAVDVPVSIDFNLADVRNPEQRKASFSKTINLYGTNEVNKLFENIFKVNVSTQTFNKNLKTPVKYFVNEILNFKGALQLLKVNLQPDGLIVYECSIIGEGGTLFVNVGEKLITGNADNTEDLDFSAYNHTYNHTNQMVTANIGTGTGYVYPFIDRGSNGGSDTVFNVEDFIPTFSAYEYIKKILLNAKSTDIPNGYTFTSTFLETTEFKNHIILPNIDKVALSEAQLANRQFYVGLLADFTPSNGINYINNTNESTLGFFDTGNQVSGVTATINESGKYNIVASHKIRVAVSHTDGTVTYAVPQNSVNLATNIFKNSGSSAIATKAETYFNMVTNGRYLVGNNDIVNEVATGEITLVTGDTLKHEFRKQAITWKYYNASNVEVTTGTGTVTVSLLSGANKTSFYALVTQKQVIAGNSLLANNALPLQIKQKDLLKSIFNAFNLYVDNNPLIENDLIIEPFDTFYNGSVIDYGNKTDLDQTENVNVNILDGKRYIYAYKPDNDYFNTLYQNTYNESFGTEIVDVESEFIKTDKKTELIFSPTPNVANYGLGIAHPRIYKKENSVVSPIAPNIRLLYCGGLKTAANPITYKDSSASTVISNSYIYAGHTDEPFAPTLDLNFGTPKEVYYTFIGASFTDNNLYNRYHKYYLENITNKDSKIVTKYLWLNAIDIKNFNFRNKFFIDNAYYIVNKIENYNPLDETSTKVELVKLLTKTTFTPTTYVLSDAPTVNSGAEILTAKLNTSINAGDGIQNFGDNCIAIGDNIVIPEGCSNITAIGNNLTFAPGISNVSVINSSDLEITQSDVNYIGGVVSNVFPSDNLVETYNVDLVFDESTMSIVNMACVTVDLTVTLPDPNLCYVNGISKLINIKKIDTTAYKVIIDGTAFGSVIDGNTTKELTSQYESVTLYTDGGNWFIK